MCSGLGAEATAARLGTGWQGHRWDGSPMWGSEILGSHPSENPWGPSGCPFLRLAKNSTELGGSGAWTQTTKPAVLPPSNQGGRSRHFGLQPPWTHVLQLGPSSCAGSPPLPLTLGASPSGLSSTTRRTLVWASSALSSMPLPGPGRTLTWASLHLLHPGPAHPAPRAPSPVWALDSSLTH